MQVKGVLSHPLYSTTHATQVALGLLVHLAISGIEHTLGIATTEVELESIKIVQHDLVGFLESEHAPSFGAEAQKVGMPDEQFGGVFYGEQFTYDLVEVSGRRVDNKKEVSGLFEVPHEYKYSELGVTGDQIRRSGYLAPGMRVHCSINGTYFRPHSLSGIMAAISMRETWLDKIIRAARAQPIE
jgi:hypothetical protein